MSQIPISILAVDDEETLLQVLKRILQHEGYYVHTAPDGNTAINMLQMLPVDLVLLDIKMPETDGLAVLRFMRQHLMDTQVIMLSAVNEIATAVECIKLGAYDYLRKPYDKADLLAVMDRALERKRLLLENKALRIELERRGLSVNIITEAKVMLEVLETAVRAAPTDSPVLIEGERGTGKELFADFLHKNSNRKLKPFLALNCSSIPEKLLESELFGHEKGAFAAAAATKQGLIEIANGGTLFLDEVGDIPMAAQAKLLKFLESGEFRRLGGNKVLKSDVRIVSATIKDLQRSAKDGSFRDDLLYRLNVITLSLPPLRDRKEDIPLLVDHFLRKLAGTREPKRIDDRAMDLLMEYDWPGNTRELENVIHRATVLSQEGLIRVGDLAIPAVRPRDETAPPVHEVRAGMPVTLKDMQKAHIEGVLKSVAWDKAAAAKILGIGDKLLRDKIKAYKLRRQA